MSKFLVNVVLILMIAFTAAAVPINVQLLDMDLQMNFDFVEAEESPEKEVEEPAPIEPTYTLHAQWPTYLYTPQKLEYQIATNVPADELKKDKSLTENVLEVYENGSLIKKLNAGQVPDLRHTIDATEDGSTLSASFEMDPDQLGLAPGHYELRLTTGLDSTLTTGFTVWQDAAFATPLQSPSAGKKIVKLWFQDPSHQYLVPVSREIRQPDNTIRTVLNALRDGPAKNAGLAEDSPAPYIPVARYADGHVRLYMDSWTNTPFTEDTQSVSMMTSSLIRTLTAIDFIDDVTFYVDKKQNSDDLQGFDMTRAYTNDLGTALWLPLPVDNGRLLLVPAETTAGDTTSILDQLKTGIKHEEAPDLIGSIPGNVVVQNTEIIGENAIITFSDEFLTAWKGAPDYQTMMIHSILYSVTSQPEITTVTLKTTTATEGTVFGFPLNTPLEPYAHVNGE